MFLIPISRSELVASKCFCFFLFPSDLMAEFRTSLSRTAEPGSRVSRLQDSFILKLKKFLSFTFIRICQKKDEDNGS